MAFNKYQNQIIDNGRRSQNIALSNHLIPKLFQPLAIGRPTIYHCERHWTWNPLPLTDFDIWLVLSGTGNLKIREQNYYLKTGVCCLFQPGDTPQCQHTPTDPLVVFTCHFKSTSLKKNVCRRIFDDVIYAPLKEFEFLRRSGELAVRAFNEGDSGTQLAATLLSQMVAHFFHKIARQSLNKPVDSHLANLSMEIRLKPGNQWTLSGMARRCALSVPHFNRKFRKIFEISPVQYVIRQRVTRAVTLLRESDMSIQQIAEALGYHDTFFFHRQFRLVAGATPRKVQLGEATNLDEA